MPRQARLDARPPRLSSRPACHPPANASLAGKLQCPHTRQWRAGLWQWRAGTWDPASCYCQRDRTAQDCWWLHRSGQFRLALGTDCLWDWDRYLCVGINDEPRPYFFA